MGRQRPSAVTNAVRTQWVLVAVSGAATLVAYLMRDDLLRAWAESNSAARQILEQGGLTALEDSAISLPAFVPVAVVTFVVYASLAWVLVAMFQHAHGWARWSLLALAAGFLFAVVVIVRAAPPTPFVVLGVVAVLLDLVLAWFLLRRECGEWIRGAGFSERREHAG
ncbi:MAG: hypothetical protein ACRDO4_12725 [Nocardioides sp.]